MNWTAISASADLVTSLAVLVTLIYLARQVGQAKEQVTIFHLRHKADAAREVLASITDTPDLVPIFAKLDWTWPDLGLESKEETVRWTTWCHSWMRTEEMNFRTSDAEQRKTQEQLLKVWLSTAWGVAFWNANKAIYDSSFADVMDRILEEVRAEGLTTGGALSTR